jgi:predicted MFS family arabinose efflux permease
MAAGLLVIAFSDVASAMAGTPGVFLGLRALAGGGWALFGTVATTTVVDRPARRGRGRAVGLLLLSETSGLLLGSAAGGWLYQRLGQASPFLFEAGCMLVGAMVVTGLPTGPQSTPRGGGGWPRLGQALRVPGVLLMGSTNAVLIAIQTGILVFLYPLYLTNRAGLGPEAVGVLVSLAVLGRLGTLWLGGDTSDRWGRMRVLIPGLLSYAGVLGCLVVLTHPVLLGVWSLAVGGAAGLVAALPTALIGDRVPPALAGVAIGWLRMMTDSGQILGPLVMGAVADAADLSAPFLLGGVLLVTMAWQCSRAQRRGDR